MKQLFPKLNDSNGKTNRQKKLKININSIGSPFNNNTQMKLFKNSKIKSHYFSPPHISSYMRTFSNNNFNKNDSYFIETIQDFANHTKIKPLEEYCKNTEDLMGRYTYSNPRAESQDIIHYESEMTKTKANYYNKKKDDIINYFNKSKRIIDYKKQKALIKFHETEFKNPIDSLGLLLKNHTIHDKILQNYQKREMQSFGKTFGNYKRIKNIINLSKNVKITSIMPKAFEKEFQEQENIKNELEYKTTEKNEKKDDEKKDNVESDNQLTFSRKNIFRVNGLSGLDFARGNVFLLTGYYQSTTTCPESREQFSFNYDPITNSIYLFSGNSCYFGNQQLWKYNLLNYNWEPIKPNEQLIEGRSGHTGIIYKSKLIIFGGRYLNNPSLADVDVYNIDTNNWTSEQLNTSFFLKLRRNHIACLVGQQMFVHGGLDEFGEYLDDSFLLNLSNNHRWAKANIISYSILPKLAYHSCCLVVPKEIQKNQKFSIYKLPEITINTINTQIREKGIYIFGGKRSDLKDPSNKLWVLKVGRKPLEWSEIKAKGKPPCPRYLCSMNYYEEGNFIIIHGGKTKSLRNEKILKDTYLFELFKFEWIKVNYGCLESIIKPRYSHAGIIYHKKLIIFGGVNEQGFSGSNFFLIKLETERNPEQFSKKKDIENIRHLLTLKSIKDTNNDEEKGEKDKDKEKEKDKDKDKDKKDDNKKNRNNNFRRGVAKKNNTILKSFLTK